SKAIYLQCLSAVSGILSLLKMLVFFFFQAEDGIRDGHVTGVQTCALPICASPSRCTRPELLEPTARYRSDRCRREGSGTRTTVRSEERRVGKECRSRWWA